MKDSNKLGILLRVSTKGQEEDGTSLEVQEQLGRKMSERLGYEPVIFNEGSQSSFKVNIEERLKLVELLDEIQNNRINDIWVYNTDRLGRNSDSWLTIYKILLNKGVRVFVGSNEKPYDLDNSMDEMVMGFLSLISQYDNKLRRMRSVLGKRNSLKNGNTFVGGTKPFGYDVKGKKLVINKEESECIKEIFKMYSDGKSTMDIKTYLDIKTSFRPKRSNSGWNIGTIQKMLGNTLYKGEQKWEWKEKVRGEDKIVDKIVLKTPMIISNRLWDDVQKTLDNNLRSKNNSKINQTLFDGLLHCKSCQMKLSIKTKSDSMYDLYTCRSVEYKWKNPEKWKSKHENCTLKKSVRVGTTDKVMINHLIDILKDSKRVRENFKVKSVSPKFEDVDDLKTRTSKKKKYLSEKRKIKDKLEGSLVDTEVRIITNEVSKSVGKKMKIRIHELIDEVDTQIDELLREINVLDNSSEWIDWLNQMYLEVDSLETLPLNEQKIFVSNYLKKVGVEYVPEENSHKFHFEFLYPIVEDTIKMSGKDKTGRRKYEILDGSTKSILVHKVSNSKNKLPIDERERLDKVISELRVEKSLSLSEVSKELNSRGFKTPTKKLWDKSKLSSYIKHMNVDVGK
jgi:site-specific DNA recombinase